MEQSQMESSMKINPSLKNHVTTANGMDKKEWIDENISEKPLKNKQTKAERRAIQEAQRAAKLERLSKGLPPKINISKKKDNKNEKCVLNEREDQIKEQNHLPSEDIHKSLDTLGISDAVLDNLNEITLCDDSQQKDNAAITIDDIASVNDTASSNKSLTDDQLQSEKAVRSRHHMDDPRFHKRMNKKLNKQKIPIRLETTRKMVIFSHLKQYDKPYIIDQNFNILSSTIGYDFIVLGLKYSDGILIGSNARSIALLMAIRQFIIDYKTPNDKVLSRDMEISLRPAISFLNQCRPLAIGMGNIIKYTKFIISSLPYTMTEDDCKDLLLSKLDNFYQNRIINAHNTITNVIQAKIRDNDVILTYSCSSLVSDILIEAISRKKRIKLIIVDSKPKFEGRRMLDKFSKIGIECIYTGINGISYLMNQVSKVILGAHGLLANGAVITRVGSAMVTTVANAFNVPVLVCCESYKFSDRAQTDAIVYNELGDPNELITSTPDAPYIFTKWKDAKTVCLLNLSYDVILPKFISALVTELGVVPCTSAPIVIRMKNSFI